MAKLAGGIDINQCYRLYKSWFGDATDYLTQDHFLLWIKCSETGKAIYDGLEYSEKKDAEDKVAHEVRQQFSWLFS